MQLTAREKMAQGLWYSCMEPDLVALRKTARSAVYAHNTTHPDARGNIAPKLAQLLGKAHPSVLIEGQFHCAYGFNLFLEEDVYINAGSTILDTAPVHIGKGTMLGPGVHIYCAEHHKNPPERALGLEKAMPVTLGQNVWIGGRAIILAGVTVGDNAIVAAGSTVTRDVPEGCTVMGNPARLTP